MDLLRRTGALTPPDGSEDATRAGRKCSSSTSQKSVEPPQTGLREAGWGALEDSGGLSGGNHRFGFRFEVPSL